MRYAVLMLMSLLAQAADVAGVWELTVMEFGNSNFSRLTLETSGEKLTGRVMQGALEGTVRQDRIEFQAKGSDGTVRATVTGIVRGDSMEGDVAMPNGEKAKWTARRIPPRPAQPRTHDFTPEKFHRSFSGAIEPVMRIFPGDTVRTKGVDAGGRDEKGIRRSLGGNPQTGPFYIERAMPGDTLVVTLNRVRLNRDTAGSGQSIMANALLPYHLRSLPRVEKFDSSWTLDRERGVARLTNPTERLKNYTVPLRPMLGCVGVAPPRGGAIPTTDSGIFGGNMDYNQIREGTTVYLPVFQPGALLFLGDGHAVQGDGELTGDALETSMEFEFTVDLREGRSIGAPRAENEEYIMAIGIAGSLDDALRIATSEMVRWIETDYKLNPAEAAIVLGTVMRYDVADLVGSQVSIVAKLPKTALAQLQP